MQNLLNDIKTATEETNNFLATEVTEKKLKMENDKIINGNCWVAYFDILGFSNMVESFPVNFVLEKYKVAIDTSNDYSEACKIKVKLFSDSFVFYTENDSQDSFRGITTASAVLFQKMFLKEIPMRGCLNVGQFYADEKNGVFFGQAITEAHNLAEGQNWLGFVLTEKTREKQMDFESVGFKSNNKLRYLEYEVPYKQKPYRRKLPTYNLNLLFIDYHTAEAKDFQKRLLIALGNMQFKAILMLRQRKKGENAAVEKSPEYKKIITKYKNTRQFLCYVYPTLKGRKTKKLNGVNPCESVSKKINSLCSL